MRAEDKIERSSEQRPHAFSDEIRDAIRDVQRGVKCRDCHAAATMVYRVVGRGVVRLCRFCADTRSLKRRAYR